MLILTRMIGECLMIGKDGDIKITVLGVKRNQVKLGIDAPINTPVNREEIHEKIQREQKEKDEEVND